MAIAVKHYDVNTYEDNWNDGESPASSAYWDSRDIHVNGTFQTAKEALNAIAEANCWTAERVCWMDRHAECMGDPGAYDGDILVDADNAEASESDMEAWRRGDKRLWTARIYVELAWREERQLTEAEAEI